MPEASNAATYVCARHSKATADTRIVGLFLCDECAKLFEDGTFEGKEPAFLYTPLSGYCSFCGMEKEVRERFWYLCNICERVVRSYASEKVASKYVLKWWKETRRGRPAIREVKLEITDPVKLMSYATHKKWKETAIANPDFSALAGESKELVFGIEMKTGRTPIPKMSEFQLDVSDCDDILSWVNRLRIPAFLFHVQVTEEFKPPTSRRVARAAWFMSIIEMEGSFKRTRLRPRENRPAAYYNRKAFHPISEFVSEDFLSYLKVMKRAIKKRLPRLYKLEP